MDAETRYDRFTLGPGMLGWVYDYRVRTPKVRRGGIASGLELGYQLEGSWRHDVRSGALGYDTGEIAPLSPGDRYDVTVPVTPDWSTQVGFIVYPEELEELAGEGTIAVRAPRVRDAHLAELSADLRRARAREDLSASLVAQARSELLRFVRTHAVREPESAVSRVKRLLARDFATPFYVRHLAEVAGTSERTLLRTFVREVGTSPTAYRLALRLNEAARLTWAEPALTMPEVAARVGFDDLPYFHRAFRREFGMTPAAYGRRERASRCPMRAV